MDATVAKIKKSAQLEIWVCLREFQSRQFVDVREHFLSGDDNKWHPTKKGIMVEPALLSEVIAGVGLLTMTPQVGTVASIQKSSRDEIQIGYRQFLKSTYGEIRVWYQHNGGERKPSQKGVTFKMTLTTVLLDALRQAEQYLEKT
jgi:transcriptional coactivator p15 (PC4)